MHYCLDNRACGLAFPLSHYINYLPLIPHRQFCNHNFWLTNIFFLLPIFFIARAKSMCKPKLIDERFPWEIFFPVRNRFTEFWEAIIEMHFCKLMDNRHAWNPRTFVEYDSHYIMWMRNRIHKVWKWIGVPRFDVVVGCLDEPGLTLIGKSIVSSRAKPYHL